MQIARLVLLAGAAGLFMLPAFHASAEVTKLRLSTDTPPGAMTTQILEVFRDKLKEAFGDTVEIEFFDSGTLGDETVHLEQLRTGQMDVVPLGSEIGAFVPEFAVFDMPFLFTDREAIGKVLDGPIGAELDELFQKNAGVKVLGFGELGFRVIYNNVRPVATPADLKDLKLRLPGSPTRILAFKTFGASPVSMPLGELYLGLQSGVVDGAEGPLATYKASSLHEVSKYVTISRHVYTPGVFGMNLAKWNELSDAQKEIVSKAAAEAVVANRAYGANADAELVDLITAETKGAITFTEPDLSAFKLASEPIWAEIAKTAGEEFSKKVIDAVSN